MLHTSLSGCIFIQTFYCGTLTQTDQSSLMQMPLIVTFERWSLFLGQMKLKGRLPKYHVLWRRLRKTIATLKKKLWPLYFWLKSFICIVIGENSLCWLITNHCWQSMDSEQVYLLTLPVAGHSPCRHTISTSSARERKNLTSSRVRTSQLTSSEDVVDETMILNDDTHRSSVMLSGIFRSQ